MLNTSADLFLRSRLRWRRSWWESGQSVLEWSGRELLFFFFFKPIKHLNAPAMNHNKKKKKKNQVGICRCYVIATGLGVFFASESCSFNEDSRKPSPVTLQVSCCFATFVFFQTSQMWNLLYRSRSRVRAARQKHSTCGKKKRCVTLLFLLFCIIFDAHLSEGPAHLPAFYH